MNALDLNLLPLVRRAGQDQSSLPGLYAVNPPRRAARGRAEDQLILYLTLTGGTPWSSEQQSQLLSRTAQIYYETSGAVTSASRTAVEFINQYLLERNLRGDSSQRQGAGWFTLGVVRSGRIYLTQAGRMRIFLITAQETQELSDIEFSGPGLGLARPPKLRYSQAELSAEAYILLAPIVPAGWQQGFQQGVYSHGLESMRRRLVAQAGPDLAAVLIQAQAGEGKLRLLWPKSAARPTGPLPAEPPGIPAEAPQTPPKEPIPQPVASEFAAATPEPEEIVAEVLPVEEETVQVIEETVLEVAPPEPEMTALPIETAATAEPAPTLAPEPIPARRLNDQAAAAPVRSTRRGDTKQKSEMAEKLGAGAKAALGAFGHALQSTLRFSGRLLKRILPDENVFNLPSNVMIFLAIAVPVIIGITAGMVFNNRGLKQQAQDRYIDAVGIAQEARAQTDPALQRVAWEETLQVADLAKKSDQQNTDIQALILEANTALDQLNKVRRLVFQPALTAPLNQSYNVTQIVTTEDELYLLIDTQGSVMRALQTGTGYQPDNTFNCGPGTYGTRGVGVLVDILALPPGSEFNATLLGMDSKANLLYCLPHERPKSIGMATPTVTGWGDTMQFALDIDTKNLYVLDPVKRNIWIYEGLAVNNPPIPFFDQTIDTLPNLDNVVDMAVNRATVYLLHSDGQTTMCEFGRVEGNPNRCQSPVQYQDDRPGMESGPTLDGALFSAIQYAPPPDPSMFLLDPATQSIYQLGVLQLNFYYQYRPQLTNSPISAKPATAFAVNASRTLFLAIGSEVYQAQIIP